MPVNWGMYTPKTVPDGDFEVALDKENFKEGKQSLKFEIRRSYAGIGWRVPGFTNEFFHVGRFRGEGRYKLSFWVKNDGSEFCVTAGGVSDHGGNMRTVIRENKQIDDWELLEFELEIPNNCWLRMELNILQPGTFWIDDIRIKRIE